jgi:hypothetical protein
MAANDKNATRVTFTAPLDVNTRSCRDRCAPPERLSTVRTLEVERRAHAAGREDIRRRRRRTCG